MKKKDVKVKIVGIQIPVVADENDLSLPEAEALSQIEDAEKQVVELETTGVYYYKDGIHYLKYDEYYEGCQEPVKNLLKYNENKLELTKKGAINTVMTFGDVGGSSAHYETPHGPLFLGILTEDYSMTAGTENMEIGIRYVIDFNYNYMTKCCLNISVSMEG